MARDNVTFRFRIDSAKAEQAIRELEAIIKRLGGTAQKTGADMGRLGGQVSKTNQNVTASAVNFQTATQGMLNLSTAAVQTYTSISNLDRANNRAKMSIIAVARAEDLLANKKERLNDMIESGSASEQKVINIRKEIATATADLTVKEEKMKIEQAAVNDIYMLFATNIANVTISSLQTLAILDKNQVILTKAKTAALKIQNLALWSNVRATGASIKSITLLSITSKIGTAMTLGFAGSIRAATVAVKAFAVAHPVLIALTAALTAALIIYESNILGVKDAIESLLPKQLAFQDEVDNARNSVGGLDDSVGDLGNTLKINFSKSLEDATSVALAFRMQVDGINESINTLNTKSIDNFVSKAAEFHNLGEPVFIGNQKKTKNLFDIISSAASFLPFFLPSAAAEPFQKGTIFAPEKFNIPQTNKQLDKAFGFPEGTIQAGIEKGSVTFQGAVDALFAERASLDPLEFLEQRELVQAQKTAKTLSPEILRGLGIVNARDLREELTGVPQRDKRLFALGFLKGDLLKRIKTTQENIFISGVGGVSPDEVGNVLATSEKTLDDPLDFAGLEEDEITANQYVRLLAASKGVGGSFTLNTQEKKIFDKLQRGEITGNRANVLINTGIDIGNVANSISTQDAMRFATIQSTLGGFNLRSGQIVKDTTRSGISSMLKVSSPMMSELGQRLQLESIRDANLKKHIQEQQLSLGGRSAELFQTIRNMGGINAQGQTSATELYQNVSVATPVHIRQRIADEAAFRYSREGIKSKAIQQMLETVYPQQGVRYSDYLYFDKNQREYVKRIGGSQNLFAAGELDTLEFLARTGLEELPTEQFGPYGAIQLMNLAKAAGDASVIGDTRKDRYGYNKQRRLYNASQVANSGLQNAMERLVQGNFGGFESSVLYGINNWFEQPLGASLVEERQIFETQIDPVLNIGFKAFGKVLQDSKRGLSEINDRIRWSERLSIISVGDSSI